MVACRSSAHCCERVQHAAHTAANRMLLSHVPELQEAHRVFKQLFKSPNSFRHAQTTENTLPEAHSAYALAVASQSRIACCLRWYISAARRWQSVRRRILQRPKQRPDPASSTFLRLLADIWGRHEGALRHDSSSMPSGRHIMHAEFAGVSEAALSARRSSDCN